jgi:transposase-like protein
MTEKRTIKSYPTAFKLAAIKRLEAGEAVWPLARELGLSRKLLHDWKKAYDKCGPEGLNRKRGPKPGPRRLKPLVEAAPKGRAGELAAARKRIAALERKIGQQAVDIDFFRRALRALEEADAQGHTPPALLRSSKP